MIILVFGLPATGKTVLAQKLSEKIDAPHLNTDIVRSDLGKTGQYDPETKQMVYDELIKRARKSLDQSFNVIVDGTFHKTERRNDLIEVAEDEDEQVAFIEMRTSDVTVRQRLENREGYSEADYKVYLQLKSEFEPVKSNHLVLWNDDSNISELTQKALEYLIKIKNNNG